MHGVPAGATVRSAMITFAEIETELEKGTFTREQTRALSKVLEMTQRKTGTDVETDLRDWMENRFVTKEEFHKTIGDLRAEMMKWMFIFWSSQLVAIAGMLFGFLKLLRP